MIPTLYQWNLNTILYHALQGSGLLCLSIACDLRRNVKILCSSGQRGLVAPLGTGANRPDRGHYHPAVTALPALHPALLLLCQEEVQQV